MNERRCPRKLKKQLKRDAFNEWGKPFRERLRWSGWDRGVEVRMRVDWHAVDVIGAWDRWLPDVGWLA